MCQGKFVNHAAGFNRCTSELQELMNNYGKGPKEVSAAVTDLKDLMAFHQDVSSC